MAEVKAYVTYGSCGCGCSGAKDITGCRFSVYPMSDRYVEMILEAIGRVETSKVWKATDALSTLYRGKRVHVLDAVKACFVQAYREGVHMAMEATISKGCPGDVEADAFLAEDDTLMNEPVSRAVHFPVQCKISLYPMGVTDYMAHIAAVVNRAIDRGIYAGSSHYVTILQGDVQDIFDYFSDVTALCGDALSHYIFQVTLSVNSPTAEAFA